jgi:sirohydrochlorin cobaltochelatase
MRGSDLPAPAVDPAREETLRGAGRRWARSALVLVAHGSEHRPAEETATVAHAEALRRRGLFREVKACFLKATPGLRETVASLRSPSAYLVPCFMGGGYSTRTVIPDELGLTGPISELARRPGRGRAERTLFYCEPVGVHPRLAGLIARRVEETCRARGLSPAAVAVLLVAHGTLKDPESGEAARRQAARLAGRGGFAGVRAAFLEEPPYLREEATRLGERPTVAVGLFAEAGFHGEEDVPRLLGLESEGGPTAAGSGPAGVWYTGPLGPDPEIAEIILDQVRAFDARHPSGDDGG